jgi:UDP-N-acetyl-2-amino-2-deoxyglucuronate dehydrogenase
VKDPREGTLVNEPSWAIGILGGGNISATHARAVAAVPACRVTAVYGQNAEKTAAIAGEHGAAVCDDLDRFIAHRPMDIVAIGTPSGLHADHIAAAAERGLHVLVEKPVDISVERVDAALAAVARAGVKLGVFFQDRLKPDLQRVKALVEEGRIGRVLVVSACVKWYRPPDYYAHSRWRGTWALDGGGALMNQGIHTVDTLLWLLGPVASLRAEAGTLLHEIEVEDTVVATLKFESGALGTFEATTAAFPGYPRRIEITGTEGTLIVDGDNLIAADLRTPLEATPVAAASANASQSSPVVSDVTAHRRVLEDFIDAIKNNREPACSGAEGRKSVAVVQAIYESARMNRTLHGGV